ncbi:ABC transporter permease, partial [Schlesneria sp.]
RSLLRDPVLVAFIIHAFTFSIITAARGVSSEVNNASLAFIDENHSTLSRELIDAFYPPRFKRPVEIAPAEADTGMDRGLYMFVVAIPPRFEEDLIAGRRTEIQINIDATAMSQASIGAGYIRNIITQRTSSFLRRTDNRVSAPVNLVVTKAFNPNGETSWFTSVVMIINQITTISVILTGAALIRERERGTLEHLLTMPLTAYEIALAKVWANGLVILFAVATSLGLIVRMTLHVPIAGSPLLLIFGVVLYLFFATALGVFLGTLARSMAQFALLVILTNIVLQLLSGGTTPVESQPEWLRYITFFFPSRHFVAFSQAIIFRGAGLETVWPQFATVAAIGIVCFAFSMSQFRQSISVSR